METLAYKFEQNIPVLDSVDVLVVGAGPGGVSAAVMAARNGARTMIVERYGCPGGMAFFGEVTPFMPNHVDGKTLDRPLFTDWCRRMHYYKTAEFKAAHPFNPNECCIKITKEEAMLAMEDLLLEAKVRMLYHHTLLDVVMNGGDIEAAVFHSKSGLCAIKAKVFIDSTGDGDLAALAGAPVEFGNEDGYCQPMTTCFKMENVDKSRMPDKEGRNRLYEQAKADGILHCPRENVLCFSMYEDDVMHFNTTRIVQKSAVSGIELSEAEIEGRRQIREFIDFLRSRVPGFENARIRSIASHVGVRESRRIRGIVYQTADDFINAAKFPDGIAKIKYDIDIHNPSGTGTKIISMKPGEWYELRYGTLVPMNTENLLMGCRAVSVDHALHSSSRVMPPICSIGQAAGMAASLCVQRECRPAALPGEDVRKKLAEVGAWL